LSPETNNIARMEVKRPRAGLLIRVLDIFSLYHK
jgi:hypothetical protein